MILAPLLLSAAVPAAADAARDPALVAPPIRAMLDAAMAAGDEGAVATIVKYARAADPAGGDEINAVANDWRAARARAREERIAEAGTFELWTGRVEAGGFVSTGNSDVTGLTAAADLSREGLKWRHKLRFQADYQRSGGVTSREHYLAAYEPNLKLDARRYIYGSAQFESDRFFGYRHRYAASVGYGYSAIQKPDLRLDLEAGPAFRQTSFTDDTMQSTLAARGKLDFLWKVSPGVTLTQDGSAYLERFNSTVSGTTALAARLIGPLSARVSYTVQYESAPPAGRVTTDTTSRASLVYSF